MRALRSVFAGTMLGAVFGIAGLLLTAAPAQAASSASLSANPTHGAANANVTVQYKVSGLNNNQNCSRVEVTFAWDGRQLGRTRLDKNCETQARFKPPGNDRAAGNHQVEAASGLVMGITTATYTIDGAGATASPTPRATATTPDGTVSDPAVVGGDSGIVTASPEIIVSPTVEAAAGTVPTSDSGSPLTSVAVLFGGVLVLGGGGILALMVIRSRRAAAAAALNEPTMHYDDIWS
jgi:hypothetical protein